jgi:acyl-CoA dehydrogenase
MIKVVAPSLLTNIADRAMQVWGAMGVPARTRPWPTCTRPDACCAMPTGPDEVHLHTIARLEMREQEHTAEQLTAYLAS